MDLSLTTEIATRLCEKHGWGAPEYIDHGNSAAVYRVEHPGHGPTALKIYDPVFFKGENALIESKRVELQAGLKGHGEENLIEIIEVGNIPEDGTWFLLMEFCPWPSLAKVIHQVPDDHVHMLTKKLVEAVLFLEEKGYVHRDIKPANIAVSEDFEKLKLLDLGVLRKISPEEGSGTGDRKFIATAQYSPPEFLGREEEIGHIGFDRINLYQVGAVLHDMIMKNPLFGEEAATENKFVLFRAVTDKIPRVVNPGVPVRLLRLCAAALEKDPAVRSHGVTLQDFLADADDAETLRRRVSRGGARSRPRPAPSLVVWEPRLRAWVGAAARLERPALGAAKISDVSFPHGLGWEVRFANVAAALEVEVRPVDEKLTVQVVSKTEPPVRTLVFEITADGADVSENDIPPLLSTQFLYALDLAEAADGPESEGEA